MEDFYIGQIFEEGYPPEAAIWCNKGGIAFIEQTEDSEEGKAQYKIKEIPAPTEDELKERMRELRDEYLKKYVDFYQEKPLLWNDLSEQEKKEIAEYRTYLLDYPDGKQWWTAEPLTFDEWKETI